MSLLGTWSHDHYSDITLEYSADSNAVISAGAGRNDTSAITTLAGTTYWLLDRVALNQPFSLIELYHGIAFNLGALPVSGRATLLQFMEADSTPQVAITVDSTGIIEAYRGTQAGTLLASALNPIVTNGYYYLESRLLIDNVAGRVELRLWASADDQTTIINFTGDTLNGGTGLIAQIGNTDGAPPVEAIPLTCNYDDAYLCDVEGSAFNTFLGNKHFQARFPNDAGFYTNWVPVPGIPNFSNVDENPPDGDVSYNYAPNVDSVVSPSFVAESHVLASATIPVPAHSEGDLLFVAIQTSNPSSDVGVQPNTVAEGFGFDTEIPPLPLIVTLPHFHFFNPTLGPSTLYWCGTVAWKVATASEPASYTFLDTRGDPLLVNEAVMLSFTGVNGAIPIESASTKAASIADSTITFNETDAFTDNDLIVAFGFTESGSPATPSGYTGNYTGGLINVSSKVNPTAAPVTIPSTAITGGPTTWGSDAYALKAQAEIETGGADTFAMEDTTLTTDAFNIKLCARVDEAGHTVGALARLDATDHASAGITPSTGYLIYQFPYEAPEWSSSGEAGYALDAEGPSPPPEEAVILWIEGDEITGFNDNDQLQPSFVEASIHTYTLDVAHVINGIYAAQTYQTGVAAVNGQISIQGELESALVRSTGYHNGATNTDLFLGDTFTLICVFNLAQYDAFFSSGTPAIVGRRGTDGGGDLAGWSLYLSGTGTPGTGAVLFERYDSSFSPITTVFSTGINGGTTYLVTVICDGSTVRLRVDGVEIDSAAYLVDLEPGANDLWYLTNGIGGGGNTVECPQGQVPYLKVWSIELDGATLAAEEAALAAKYQ